MTDTSTERTDVGSETAEVKKPFKEVPVVQDQGFFQHDTGDTYDGFFEVKKKDRIAKMHGPGLYTTKEGDTYLGTWEADKLGGAEEVTIEFHEGSKYEGLLKDWSFSGRGRYYYPDGSILKCDFADNTPIGFLTLTDPNEHTWLGKAEQGFGWLEPVNHFYELLEKSRRKSMMEPSKKVSMSSKLIYS